MCLRFTLIMAEDFEKRHKQSKVFSANPNLQTNFYNEDDLIPQTGRKKSKSAKGGVKMNPASLSSSLSASSSTTNSKTVAAILKQQKDFKVGESMSAPRSQHMQHQFQHKRSSHKNTPSPASGLQDNLNYVKSINSPLSHVGNTTPANLSPAMSPSNLQVLSPSPPGKEPNHSATTTKSSSLSRELSPSRITAQIVKVMSDTSQSSTQNLLLSVLQGNMPDPMGILNASKTDLSSSIVGGSLVPASNHIIPSVSRISPVSGKNNISSTTLPSQHHNFIPTTMFESGLFLNQTSNLDERGSPSEGISSLQQVHGSNVTNLLTASAGSVQTVNVSHVPKTTNIPTCLNPGGSLSSGHNISSSSPRHSPRSAMEVAQQIKLEANGQSASAQRVAMQQQLRSQIKGSRSLDAQLAFRQNPGVASSGSPSDHHTFNNSHQLHPLKEIDQQKQTLEATMPLLASKLSSVPSSSNVSSNNSGLLQHNSSSSKTKQNLPLTASLLKSPLPSSTNPSNLYNFSVASTSTLSPLTIRKSGHQSISSQQQKSINSNIVDSRQHQQPPQQQYQQKQLQQQQQQLLGMSVSSVPTSAESAANLNESSWSQAPKNSYSSSMSAASSVGMIGINDHNKQPMLQRLIQATDSSGVSEHTVQTDIVMKVEGQAQTGSFMSKQLRGAVISNNLTPQPQSVSLGNKGTMSQSIQAVGIGGLAQTRHSGLSVLSGIEKRRKSGPGETKQTAIDVDMDFGNLASIVGDDQSSGIPNISQIKFSAMSQSVNEIPTDSLILGNDLSEKFTNSVYYQQSQFSKGSLDVGENSKLPNATFVKDITGVSNPSGPSGDLTSFLPISSTTSTLPSFFSGEGTIQTTETLMQSSNPISYPYPSSINISTSAATAASNFLQQANDFDNNPPPPPYPSNNKLSQKFLQQQQQQQHNQNLILQQQQQQQQMQQQQQRQQQPRSKSSTKHTAHNPFTFPTTGVKVQAGPDSLGLLSYTINTQPMENKPSLKGEIPSSRIKENKSLRNLEKSQSDISCLATQLNAKQWSHDDKMPRLVPQGTVKLEDGCLAIGTVIKSEDNGPIEEQPLVQPFNQRVANLSCLPSTNTVYRASYRTHAIAAQRARSGVITNTAKTLDVLRQNLQRSINKEISDIIKKYTCKFFEPALANIRQNNNEDLLGNEHINYVCRQILEEAKSDYSLSPGRRSVTPTTDIFDNISDSSSINGRRSNNMKRSRVSDSDSEKGSDAGSVRRTIKRKGRPPVHGSGRVTPSKTLKSGDFIKKEGPKWDPDRLKPDTFFIMGAKANKALGLGNTRGRLYIRHPDTFKYVGDSDDKLWLCDRTLMPPTGGKAYLMLMEDIEDLSRSDDYRDSPNLLMHECVGFNVPEWMLVKMKEQMGAQRTDGQRKSQLLYDQDNEHESRPKVLPFSTFAVENIKSEVQRSPADTEDMEFLANMDCDDNRLSSTISPFNMTGGFEEAGGGSPGELAIDDRPPMSSIFT